MVEWPFFRCSKETFWCFVSVRTNWKWWRSIFIIICLEWLRNPWVVYWFWLQNVQKWPRSTVMAFSNVHLAFSPQSPHQHVPLKALWRWVNLPASFNAWMAPSFGPATVQKANTLHLIHFHTRAVSQLTAVSRIFSHHHLCELGLLERNVIGKGFDKSPGRTWRDGMPVLIISTY